MVCSRWQRAMVLPLPAPQNLERFPRAAGSQVEKWWARWPKMRPVACRAGDGQIGIVRRRPLFGLMVRGKLMQYGSWLFARVHCGAIPGRVAPGDCSPRAPAEIRTCPFRHTALHIMNSLRDGSLSESALRLVPDAATVIRSCTRLWVSMHPPCVPPTVP